MAIDRFDNKNILTSTKQTVDDVQIYKNFEAFVDNAGTPIRFQVDNITISK